MNSHPDKQVTYYAGWNMPGFPPAMDPKAFNTFNEAREWLIEELTATPAFEDDVYEETAEEVAWIRRQSRSFCTHELGDGCVYWVGACVGPRVDED